MADGWMPTTHVRKFQVQQVATAKLRQVSWSKERHRVEFDVRVFGDINGTWLERNVSSQTVAEC